MARRHLPIAIAVAVIVIVTETVTVTATVTAVLSSLVVGRTSLNDSIPAYGRCSYNAANDDENERQ